MSIIDCRTLPCPQPVVLSKKYINENPNKGFTIHVDNEPAVENVSRFLRNNGYLVEVFHLGGKLWGIEAKCVKGHSCTPKGEKEGFSVAELEKNSSPKEAQKTLVLLTSDTLGRDDLELGAKLMESFLSSLIDIPVWQVVMINGAVRLGVGDTKNVESLKKLEEAGVQIFLCGTCLNHYGLYNDKQVGESTNMLDIISALDLADKVIRL